MGKLHFQEKIRLKEKQRQNNDKYKLIKGIKIIYVDVFYILYY